MDGRQLPVSPDLDATPRASATGDRAAVPADGVPVRAFPLAFDAPNPTSVDLWALALTIAAALAIFRIGMIPTLLGTSAAGIVLHFAGPVA